eukprot:364453-Chlamydomonas_euryale.AAC.11
MQERRKPPWTFPAQAVLCSLCAPLKPFKGRPVGADAHPSKGSVPCEPAGADAHLSKGSVPSEPAGADAHPSKGSVPCEPAGADAKTPAKGRCRVNQQALMHTPAKGRCRANRPHALNVVCVLEAPSDDAGRGARAVVWRPRGRSVAFQGGMAIWEGVWPCRDVRPIKRAGPSSTVAPANLPLQVMRQWATAGAACAPAPPVASAQGSA